MSKTINIKLWQIWLRYLTRPSQTKLFDAAVEALIQGNTQQQLPHLA